MKKVNLKINFNIYEVFCCPVIVRLATTAEKLTTDKLEDDLRVKLIIKN